MIDDNYLAWEVVAPLPTSIYSQALSYEVGTVKISLTADGLDVGKAIEITFKQCLAYRVVQESGRLKSLDNLTLGMFSKANDSQFVNWFKDEGLGIYDDWELTHYAIVTLDNIIDVITTIKPVIQIK